MQGFGVLLKAQGSELLYVRRFLDSFREFAQEKIPLVAVVPDEDAPIFQDVLCELGEALPESIWSQHLVNDRAGASPLKNRNQKIIKLAFASEGIFANYLCADPKSVFIRPFSSRDFMATPRIPYTFLTEDAELRADPIYEAKYGEVRDVRLRGLRDFLELPQSPYRTIHYSAVFSSKVCESLANFLFDRDLTWADALELCPCEFSWYNFWLERNHDIPVIEREPIFKAIELEHQYLELAIMDVRKSDLARGYIGILSSLSVSGEVNRLVPGESSAQALGRYVEFDDLVNAVVERILRRLPRIRRLFQI